MTNLKQRFEEKFGKAGPERNSDSIGRKAGCDDCAENIELREEHYLHLSQEVKLAEEAVKEKIDNLPRRIDGDGLQWHTHEEVLALLSQPNNSSI